MKKMTFILWVLIISCSSDHLNDVAAQEPFETISEIEGDVFNVVNAHRMEKGLSLLKKDPNIYGYALQQTEFMIASGSVSHHDFESRASLLVDQTAAVAVSENVAKNYLDAATVFEGWKNSKGHYKNIKGDYTHTVVCVARDDDGVLYYTQIFYKSGTTSTKN